MAHFFKKKIKIDQNFGRKEILNIPNVTERQRLKISEIGEKNQNFGQKSSKYYNVNVA